MTPTGDPSRLLNSLARLMNENSSHFGQARFQIELKPHAAVEVMALAEAAPPYKTTVQKKASRRRRSIV